MEYRPRRKIEKRLEKRLFGPITLGLGVSAAALTVCAGSLIGALMLFNPKQTNPPPPTTPIVYQSTQEPIPIDTPTPIPTNTPIPPTPTATPKPDFYLTDQWTELAPGTSIKLDDEMFLPIGHYTCAMTLRLLVKNNPDNDRQSIIRYDTSTGFSLVDDTGKIYNYRGASSWPGWGFAPWCNSDVPFIQSTLDNPSQDHWIYLYFDGEIPINARYLTLTAENISGSGPFVFRKELSPPITPIQRPEFYLASQWAELAPGFSIKLEDRLALPQSDYMCAIRLELVLKNNPDNDRQFIIRYNTSSGFSLVDDTGKIYNYKGSAFVHWATRAVSSDERFKCYSDEPYIQSALDGFNPEQSIFLYFDGEIPTTARYLTLTADNISSIGPFVFRKEL